MRSEVRSVGSGKEIERHERRRTLPTCAAAALVVFSCVHAPAQAKRTTRQPSRMWAAPPSTLQATSWKLEVIGANPRRPQANKSRGHSFPDSRHGAPVPDRDGRENAANAAELFCQDLAFEEDGIASPPLPLGVVVRGDRDTPPPNHFRPDGGEDSQTRDAVSHHAARGPPHAAAAPAQAPASPPFLIVASIHPIIATLHHRRPSPRPPAAAKLPPLQCSSQTGGDRRSSPGSTTKSGSAPMRASRRQRATGSGNCRCLYVARAKRTFAVI